MLSGLALLIAGLIIAGVYQYGAGAWLEQTNRVKKVEEYRQQST